MLQRVASLLRMNPPLVANRGLLFGSGHTVPTDGTDGYQPGCLWQHTDGTVDTALYVNEGTVASCDFNSITIFGGTAGTVSASKGTVVDAYKTLRWGGFNTGAALTDAVSFATVPNTWSDGQLDILAVFGGTGTNLTSAYSAKCARFRHVILTATGTVAQETYGAVGQLVVRGTTLTHLHAGLMGTFEGHTSGVVLSSSYLCGHAAVTARIGGHAAITATTPIAGFLAFNNASAALASGSSHAFTTAVYSTTYPWSTGIYMPQGTVTMGLRIGIFASSAATTGGIIFSTAQNVYSDGQLSTAEINGVSNADLTSAYSAKCLRSRHVVSGTALTVAHETYGSMGQLVVKGTTLTHLHAGLIGTFEGHTSGVVVNAAYVYGAAAVMARVGGGAAITATTVLSGVSSVWNGAALASGSSAAFAACSTGTGNWTYLLAADNCDYFFFAATGTNNENACKLATVTLGGTGDGTLRIKINTTEYFIPFYAAGSISGE